MQTTNQKTIANKTDLAALAAIAASLRNDSNGVSKAEEKVLDYTRRKAQKALLLLDQEVVAAGEKVTRLEMAEKEAIQLAKTATGKKAEAIQAAIRRTRFEVKVAKREYRELVDLYGAQKSKLNRVADALKAA